jgi:Icc-related predicted phosphoesterase
MIELIMHMTLNTVHIKRLAWATDIHLDFVKAGEVADFCERIVRASCDALVITGDIAEGTSVAGYLKAVAAHVRIPIYFVLGNHDFYGSYVSEVRAAATQLSQTISNLHYLPAVGLVPLTDRAALVGCDGWGDLQHGKGSASRVEMQDHYLIRDLASLSPMRRFARLRTLGEEEAERVRATLPQALREFPHVIMATHVPPFRETCWHRGRISDDDWLPHFTCKAVGDALLEIMKENPRAKLTVLCGHTHGAGVTEVLPNLKVLTGGARYGRPALQGVINLEEM